MKLMTLNIWGGHVREPLLSFIPAHRDTDIFCLQEVYHRAPAKISSDDKVVSLDIFAELQELLPQHQGFFRPTVNHIYGLATFVKKNIEVLKEGAIKIHDNPHYIGRGPSHSRNLQWLECRLQETVYTILNIHGLWNGKGKTDSPERIAQSHIIKNFIDTLHTPLILCGDFNLRPDTESMHIIEAGLKNLVRSHHITSTRTKLYNKPEGFADYILCSPDLRIHTFKVLPDEVSDHAPLLLEFDDGTQ